MKNYDTKALLQNYQDSVIGINLGIYYQVHITKKSGHPRDVYELDFSEGNLVREIVEPYRKGQTFMCGGESIDPFDVEKIQINKTDAPSSLLLSRIRVERAKSEVVVAIPDESYVMKNGINVTRKFITSPPKRRRTVSKYPSKKRSSCPKTVKETVWRKYFRNEMSGKCYVCGKAINFTDFEVGHNKPFTKGGKWNINNLRPICRTCNRSMGTTSIEAFKRKYFTKNPVKKKKTGRKRNDLAIT